MADKGIQEKTAASGQAAGGSDDASPSPGRQLFVDRGCIACHGMNAQGTRLAPSLIGVADKFPGDKLPYLLRHPTSKMRDGGMPTISLNEAQLNDLVTYLSSLRPEQAPQHSTELKAALGAAPPRTEPSAVPANKTVSFLQVKDSPPNPQVARGERIFQRNACESCHGVSGRNGTVAAPALAGTASLLPGSAIEALLRHHTNRMERGGMPPTNFNQQDMSSIVAYIRSMTPAPEMRRLIASKNGNEKD